MVKDELFGAFAGDWRYRLGWRLCGVHRHWPTNGRMSYWRRLVFALGQALIRSALKDRAADQV